MTGPLGLKEICEELGLEPQFLFNLAEITGEFYETFYIPKRSGGFREISASQTKLKRVQRILLDELFAHYKMPPYVHGCVRGRSTVSNAIPHTKKRIVLNIDIRNFFSSISINRVAEMLASKFNFDSEACDVISKLCTFEDKLPQGAPTSPVLANLVALDLDSQIREILNARIGQQHYQYTRYVDDITISGNEKLIELVDDIHSVINNSGFAVNPRKSRVLRPSVCQKVTGIVVNEKISPPKKFLRKIRQQFYYCNKFGLADFCKHENINRNEFIRRLRGSISYIRLTRPDFADQMVRELGANLPIWRSMEEEESQIRKLKEIIDGGHFAYFFYENVRCKVAPSEIMFDDENGLIAIKAFQLFPSEGWRVFSVYSIGSLEIEGVQTSISE